MENMDLIENFVIAFAITALAWDLGMSAWIERNL